MRRCRTLTGKLNYAMLNLLCWHREQHVLCGQPCSTIILLFLFYQGLPEGHTKPCWPLAGSNIGGHRLARAKDVDAEVAASKRWDLLGNAVTVPVARWLGERLVAPYAYKYHTAGVANRRMDHLVNEGFPSAETQWSVGVVVWGAGLRKGYTTFIPSSFVMYMIHSFIIYVYETCLPPPFLCDHVVLQTSGALCAWTNNRRQCCFPIC